MDSPIPKMQLSSYFLEIMSKVSSFPSLLETLSLVKTPSSARELYLVSRSLNLLEFISHLWVRKD